MNKYVGKICPYCKTAFTEDDDIVVCSYCDMPHHKDCWIKNKGCTTVGCLGTMKSSDCGPVTSTEIQNDDLSSTQATASVYCTRCGAPIQSGDAFCGHCGSPVNAQPTAPGTYSQTITPLYAASTNNLQQNNNSGGNTQNSGNEYNQTSSDNQSSSTNDINRLIGTKTEYYLRKFNKFKGQGEKASWNWCAFFVAPYWFIYRKMYGYGAGILGVLMLLWLIDNWFLSLLSLAGYIIFAIYGNYIYMQQIDKHANVLLTKSEPEKSKYTEKYGGTNAAATVLAIICYAIFITNIHRVIYI